MSPGPRDLVICSLERWDQVWRRNQLLVAGLLDADPALRVLFVEPSADPLHELRSRRRPARGAGLRRVDEVSPRLHTLQLTKWLPRVVGPFADIRLQRRLLRACRSLAFAAPALWVNDPGWAGLLVRTGWPALYDITDDWLAAHRGEREHARLVRAEGLLMERCQRVVVCSTGLRATKSPLREVDLIPNAVDVARFQTPGPRPADLPPRPVALYAGTLHEDRLDVALCVELGRQVAKAGGSLVFVGPVALSPGHAADLASTPGVRLLGARPHLAVPGYLQHADALVVPHVVDEFTDSLDPIKLYEYEAVGRPIVATPVAGFRDLAGRPGVVVASGPAFLDAVTATLQHPPTTVGPFDVPDWSVRVEAMAEVLAGLAAPEHPER